MFAFCRWHRALKKLQRFVCRWRSCRLQGQSKGGGEREHRTWSGSARRRLAPSRGVPSFSRARKCLYLFVRVCVCMDVSVREVRSVMYRQQVYAANMLCVLVVFGVPLSLAGAVLAFCFRAWARGRGRGRAAARISETKKAS